MKHFILHLLYGCIIGVANAIPGVSGGTMAVVLGIYDRLIGSMSHFFEDIKDNLKFLLAIIIGAGAGIKVFGTLIKYLIAYQALPTNFFFTGLIAGSIPMLYKEAREKGRASFLHYTTFLLFIAMMACLAFLGTGEQGLNITSVDASTFLYFLVVSFIAAVGMLLPGVSGSMLLMLFGAYFSIITAVSDLNFFILIPVGLGVGLGLLLGSLIINFCLKRFPIMTYYAILGMVVGSLVAVIKNALVDGANMMQLVEAGLFLLIGISISLAFEKWNAKVKARLN